eukprot:405027-Pleurochrysis_carterae.AAC.1
MEGIIKEVKQLWPTCKMVHGCRLRDTASLRAALRGSTALSRTVLVCGCKRTIQRTGALGA